MSYFSPLLYLCPLSLLSLQFLPFSPVTPALWPLHLTIWLLYFVSCFFLPPGACLTQFRSAANACVHVRMVCFSLISLHRLSLKLYSCSISKLCFNVYNKGTRVKCNELHLQQLQGTPVSRFPLFMESFHINTCN